MNAEDNTLKEAKKGIPHAVKLNLDNYKDTLFNSLDEYNPSGLREQHTVIVNSLRCDNTKKMSRMSVIKRGLSDLYHKHYVDNDAITCSPLKLNGNYL